MDIVSAFQIFAIISGDSEKQAWEIYTIMNELQRASLELSYSFVTPWTIACQAPLSMRFPRQEYWSRLPFPSPGNLPNPGIKPMSFVSSALAKWILYYCATREAGKCFPSIKILTFLCDIIVAILCFYFSMYFKS